MNTYSACVYTSPDSGLWFLAAQSSTERVWDIKVRNNNDVAFVSGRVSARHSTGDGVAVIQHRVLGEDLHEPTLMIAYLGAVITRKGGRVEAAATFGESMTMDDTIADKLTSVGFEHTEDPPYLIANAPEVLDNLAPLLPRCFLDSAVVEAARSHHRDSL